MLSDDALYENEWEPERQPFRAILRPTSSTPVFRRQDSVSSTSSSRSIFPNTARLSIQDNGFISQVFSNVRTSINENNRMKRIQKRYSVDQKIPEVDRIRWLLRMERRLRQRRHFSSMDFSV